MRRFYQQPLKINEKTSFLPEKISGNELHVFYVANSNSNLVLHRSASGELEQVLDVFVKCKQRFRTLAERKCGHPYLIHCAATRSELKLQTSLLFGTKNSAQLAQGIRMEAKLSAQDLIGADGWKDLREAFEALSGAVDWCVLRGWETLPHQVAGDDLDILVSSKKAAFSSLGLLQPDGPDGSRNGYLTLNSGEKIKFDVHWVGDGYFDSFWQADVLKRRVSKNGVFRPEPTQALMTAIYSEIVARPLAREKQMGRIKELARDVAHSGWLTDEALAHRRSLLEVLRGFMLSNGYVMSTPLVRRHEIARDALKILPQRSDNATGDSAKAVKNLLKRIARSVLPPKLRSMLLSIFRKHYGSLLD
jgi:hypothetical protein